MYTSAKVICAAYFLSLKFYLQLVGFKVEGEIYSMCKQGHFQVCEYHCSFSKLEDLGIHDVSAIHNLGNFFFLVHFCLKVLEKLSH